MPEATTMSGACPDGLPRDTPESRGVKSADIFSFLKDGAELGINFNSFMLYHRGAVISEGYWKPYAPELPHMMHSATKSFTTVAVGMAIQEGYFSKTDKVLSFFPEDAPEDASENLKAMTVEHLLTQTSGHTAPRSGGSWRSLQTSWIKEFFKVPVMKTPGTHFQYSSATSYMLSAIVQRTTGTNALDFLRARMLQPMGIEGLRWDVSPDGINPGGNGITCRTSDLLKLAILFLGQGKWEGQQLLDKDYAVEACKSQYGNKYGYQWWIGLGSFYAYGLFGQLAVVLPAVDAILVTTASEPWGEDILRSWIWRRLPSLFNLGESVSSMPSSTDELRRYLATLNVLPPLPTRETALPPLFILSRDCLFLSAPNIDNIVAFNLTFPTNSEEAIFRIWDHRGMHSLTIGLQSYHSGSTTVTCGPLHHGYETESQLVVAGGHWSAPDTFSMIWHFPETAFQDRVSIRLSGDGETALFERGVNVNSFATQRPPIVAKALSKDLEGFHEDSVDAIEKARGSVDFANLKYPARTVKFAAMGTSLAELLGREDTKAILEDVLPQKLLQHPSMAEAGAYDLWAFGTRVMPAFGLERLRDDVVDSVDKRLKEVSLEYMPLR
jgi:CubicO group peptidase (beta-lactamase class C family)